MRFRKLRIAFSATCLIACVLLIVLWVRSYWWYESVSWGVGATVQPFNICSISGGTVIQYRSGLFGAASPMKWQFQNKALTIADCDEAHVGFQYLNGRDG